MTEIGILNGFRVLSLEQVHVLPWGTAFLADFGAEVVRVESVDHMQDRRSGPFPDYKPSSEWWNEGGSIAYYGLRNKESLCLDVTDPLGKETFLRLVKNSHIVTDNFRPGTMRRLGLDHESLVEVNPQIISLSCTAYGHTGPWRAAGSRARTADAACGLSNLTGYEDGPSYRASSNYMDHSGGNNNALALMLALWQLNKTGKGMRLDLTMQETGVMAIGPAILEAQRGIVRRRLGTSHLWKAPHNVYPCSGNDRWIAIAVSCDDEWEGLKAAMDHPHWADEARFKDTLGRWNNRHDLDGLISDWSSSRDNQSLMKLLQSHSVPSGAVLTAEDLSTNDHLMARGYLEVFNNPHAPWVGPRVYAARPFKIPGIDTSIRHIASLGEHNVKVLSEIGGLSAEEIQSLADKEIIADKPKDPENVPQDFVIRG